MDTEFWLRKWEQNEIGFHSAVTHPFLEQHFRGLAPKPGGHVLVPLCGKSLDLLWLVQAGFQVTGIELSRIAVEDLFESLHLTPSITVVPGGFCYTAQALRVFVADIFAVTPSMVGRVDAVYDRAALIALPENMRCLYVQHVLHLAHGAPHLLVCVEYEQSKRQGPPFAVLAQEVTALYSAQYECIECDKKLLPEGIKGVHPAYETAWHLLPKVPA